MSRLTLHQLIKLDETSLMQLRSCCMLNRHRTLHISDRKPLMSHVMCIKCGPGLGAYILARISS
jgi:hypothetical protein